ncbi:FAD-dependent oxidoreductase [Subtercola endophyticus]|uniref:FAD-dependent oxidoreductase n=1 Tax=Subtercola endophyticus TaxID=2895559 RepID=UPI001E37D38B|nr:FAD-dependent oxidoreductase [Subtercola endophyticus]UFS60108.1 FAD-dependent oxidoreductase [Subtercola endophyticus]
MTSLWLATSRDIGTDEFAEGARYDEVIVGGGLTGLVTAVLFAQAGKRVAVLESRFIGAVATGNTSAKLSLLQGSHLQNIKRHTYQAIVQAYVDGNRAGQQWMLDYAAERDIPVQRRDAVSYAGTPDGTETVEREFRVARLVGLDVRLKAELDLPFPTFGAVVLPDQAQFDPMDVLGALVTDIRELGGVIIENARVTGVAAKGGPGGCARVRTAQGDVFADHVLLTTGTPILDRGLYFAKLKPQRSYVTSYRVPGPIPSDMYLSVDSPSRSLRTAADSGGDELLVGGNGHVTGREVSAKARVDDLQRWTERYFPGAELTHSWSAQDYETPHRVPFVGYLPRGRGRIYLATGYDKWGMTNAVTAALTLVSDILGDSPDWAEAMHHRVTLPAAIGSGIGSGAAVGWWAVKGWAGALTGPRVDALQPPNEGAGVIGRAGIRPVGVSTVDGATCAVSGICTHLGGVLSWNDAEASWDCPLHGSRFSSTGALLEGPATRDLTAR